MLTNKMDSAKKYLMVTQKVIETLHYWCAKPRIRHETETESETNKGFVNETESFELKDSKPKPNPKPIRNFDKKDFFKVKSLILALF